MDDSYDHSDITFRLDEGVLESVADHPVCESRLSAFKALSFFSGAMGLDLGLEAEGIHVLLASEIDPVTRQTIFLNRPLSVQEYQRLQQFPDHWKIAGTILDQYRQIGNAVPVGLGRAIARLILSHTEGRRPQQGFDGFPYSRYRLTDDASWRGMRSRCQRNRHPELHLS